jgi:acylphosphatase
MPRPRSPTPRRPKRPPPLLTSCDSRMDELVRRFLVIGKVQGVFFRHSARLEAKRLNIRGLARNLADGSVEVLAQGSLSALAAMHEWLQRGPAQARVDTVRESDASDRKNEIPASFEVF